MEEQSQEKTKISYFRLISLEKDVDDIKKQIGLYVLLRENDVQLQSIQADAERIEDRIEKHLIDSMKQLGEINTKFLAQEAEAQAQRESQTALQIKVLWGIVSLIFGLLTSIFVGYITHFFH